MPRSPARIKAYELAYRMQTSVPEVLKFDTETAETKKLYGIDDPATRDFGMQMLAAQAIRGTGCSLHSSAAWCGRSR
jgi:hypothetical protein